MVRRECDMDKERFRQVESLFWELLAADGLQQDAVAADASIQEQTLQQMALSLIEKDRELRDSPFLESPKKSIESASQNANLKATAGCVRTNANHYPR